MNVFKVAWKSLRMAWANYTSVRIIIMVILLAIGFILAESYKSCRNSTRTQITLSTMVKIGDGDWQEAECSAWVEGKSDNMDAKMWGVWVGNGYITDNVKEVEHPGVKQ